MNVSILIKSFSYVTDNYKTLVSLSIWINKELTENRYQKIKLKYALCRSDFDVSSLFIDRYKDKEKLINHTSHTYKHNRELTKLILRHSKGMHPDYIYTLIHNACSSNDIDMLNFMLQNDFKINELLMGFFAENGNLDSIKIFEASGINLTKTMIVSAVRGKHYHVVEYLIDKGIEDNSSLIYACKHGKIDIVEKMLKQGSRLNRTLTSYDCSISEYLDIIKLLLDYNQSHNMLRSCDLIELCIEQNRLDIIKILFNPEYRSNHIYVHLAIKYNNIAIIKFFTDNHMFDKKNMKRLLKIARIERNQEIINLLQKLPTLD